LPGFQVLLPHSIVQRLRFHDLFQLLVLVFKFLQPFGLARFHSAQIRCCGGETSLRQSPVTEALPTNLSRNSTSHRHQKVSSRFAWTVWSTLSSVIQSLLVMFRQLDSHDIWNNFWGAGQSVHPVAISCQRFSGLLFLSKGQRSQTSNHPSHRVNFRHDPFTPPTNQRKWQPGRQPGHDVQARQIR
jgi:hypothetical protein